MSDLSNQQDPQNDAQLPEEILEQAALWLVTLADEEATDEDIQTFKQWQQQDIRHVEAVTEMQQTMGLFHRAQQTSHTHIASQIIEQVLTDAQLEEQNKSWSQPRNLLLLAGMAILLALLSWQILPTDYWLADSRNDSQDWSEQVLSDQSQIHMSGKTAYNVKYNADQRIIELLQGNILVDVAKDANRPFIVQTRFAKIKALGTRFIIHHSDQRTTLIMLHSATEVAPVEINQHAVIVKAGQQVSIDEHGVSSALPIQPSLLDEAWQQHALVVDKMPLGQVLDILQSYQSRNLHYRAEDLQHIQVSAILPLNDSALTLLQQSLDIRIDKTLFGQIKIEAKK